jgi:hypothetical protein
MYLRPFMITETSHNGIDNLLYMDRSDCWKEFSNNHHFPDHYCCFYFFIMASNNRSLLYLLPSDILHIILNHVAGISSRYPFLINHDLKNLCSFLRTCKKFSSMLDARDDSRVAKFWEDCYQKVTPAALRQAKVKISTSKLKPSDFFVRSSLVFVRN